MNNSPRYPLLVLDPRGWLGWRPDDKRTRFSLYGALNTKRWIAFDAEGNKWRVAPGSFPYPDTWWTRLLASTLWNPRFESKLHWAPAGQYTLGELKNEICSLVNKDDDLLTQFVEDDRINGVVRGTKTFEELTGKLRTMKVIRQ